MFERKYKQSAEQTKDIDLEQFIWRCVQSLQLVRFIVELPSPPKPKATPTPRYKVAAKPVSVENTPTKPTKPTSSPNVVVNEPIIAVAGAEPMPDQVQRQSTPPTMTPIVVPNNVETLASKEALLYLWDTPTAQFESQGVFTAIILRRTDVPFHYCLAAHNGEHLLLAHDFSSDMNPKWTHKMSSITWNNQSTNGQWSGWCLRFASSEDYSEMCDMFIKCMWETLHQMPWGKMKEDEQRYVRSSNEDVEMKDVSEEDEEAEVMDDLEVGKGRFTKTFARAYRSLGCL